MARLVFDMNVSLDGYVDHDRFMPDPDLFRHWIGVVRTATGQIYGRKLYEIMRYWEQDDPDWTDDLRAFAEAWRNERKWVVSRTLTAVGPNATLISYDLEGVVRRLKQELEGEIHVGGPALAQGLTDLGLIDEYRLYLHPVVLGQGAPFFAGVTPPLRLVAHDRIGGEAIRLTYVPA
ncbi:dihydrofolate reductase family protein [Roseibacterium beibuensis]|uniref:dihydrofolate reductase family protein n=1 Tax=[Roseibacterium] beibuensis TaxID=1193142 RepID=UPI00217ED8EE|nr:dihydrofolate reductase family protein [Roseibacterium beibuensis]MCS6625636.1 dihydrofolate reductase family protein [Roseibacterium beibuensis]